MTDETSKVSKAGKATAALSHERLAAIHGRLALISAWPWVANHIPGAHLVMAHDSLHGDWAVAQTHIKETAALDAEFIAHAPEDVDALLTAMEQLREQNEQLRAELDDALRDLADCEAEL